MHHLFSELGRQFRLLGTLSSYEEIQTGNINRTYRVRFRTDNGAESSYIFQKINTSVFEHPAEIMENIGRVTAHIREKCPGQPYLHFHSADTGKNYAVRDHEFWRAADWIDSVTFDSCEDHNVIRAVGEAFGGFQTLLSDFDGSVLHETIPGFHDTRQRLDRLFADARRNSAGRTPDVQTELYRLRLYYKEACVLSDRYRRGEFPIRVTHNDTKANNVLFDRETLHPLTVIDLDTVMPGMAMIDFGDAVRFLANTAAEDEPDLSKVSLDEEKFAAFADGFLGQVRGALTPAEIASMVRGVFTVTAELAARFLDDYINGDVYFKVNYPEHNLIRARCQLHLAEDIFAKAERLEKKIRNG